MKATETKVEDFLSANKTQFVIPVYQRNYDWTTIQCKQLLDDIINIGSINNSNVHFIGSVVYVHDDVYTSSRMKELIIIDGQQRLTTLTLIYLVLYRLGIDMKDEGLVNEINETYLINKFASEDEKLKLKPTENNSDAIKFLLRSDKNEEFTNYSKVIENFNYFKSRITEFNYETVLKGLEKLMFVEISLDRKNDNPQRIFESLNSTGLELSQADLIRNYILMGLNRKNQTKIYNNYWKIVEKLAKDETLNKSKVSDFIRDYLTLINNKIPNKSKVYLEFKTKYPTIDFEILEDSLLPIKSLVKFYNKLINPTNEIDKDIRLELKYINKLEINVAYPFLMKVYEDFSENIIDKQTFIDVLDFVQSYVWRRFIVGLPTNALNKIFMVLYEKIEKDSYLFSLQKWLIKRTGVQRFPKNNEVVESLKLKDVYNIKSKNRTYLLERLENFNNREPVIIEGNTDITIEHIFPQNPNPKWKIELGNDEYLLIKETYLNTIGNLTLSGNNGKLGNKTFLYKRDLPIAGYKDSRLWLNKYLSEIDNWNVILIEKRFELLSKRFLEIWKYPDIQINERDENNEVNVFEAEDPKSKKLDYAIFYNQKLEFKQFTKLYAEVFRQLFELEPETFFSTDLGDKIVLTKSTLKDNLRQAIKINDTYYIEGNVNNSVKFERIKYALTIFNSEDELVIKYAEE